MATHGRKQRVRAREERADRSRITARPTDEEHTHEREIVTESGLSVAPEELAVAFLARATAQDNFETMRANADTDLELAASPTDDAPADAQTRGAKELWGRMVEFFAARTGRLRDEE